MTETFTHRGVEYKVVEQAPKPKDIRPGQWVRVLFDPYDSKDPIIGEVLSCRPFWALDSVGYRDTHRVDIFRNGDVNDPYYVLLPDKYLEIVEPTTPRSLGESDDNRISNRSGRRRMNIVACFDGTWNENETQNTNIHRLFEHIDRNTSISNYYSGVGVGSRLLGSCLDALTGRGVFRTVRAAYTFVRGNFRPGDRVFVFGFSRGAYAARHLAGMISRVGLGGGAESAYDKYRQSLISKQGIERSGSSDRQVHFLGLFDCVPGNQIYKFKDRLPLVNNPILEPNIRRVAHAVSRDERRWSFRPLIFQAGEKEQQLRQAWFPGFHSDVGGEDTELLNNFGLAWMLAEAGESGLVLREPFNHDFDPNVAGKCSDWWTTKLGLACIRTSLPDGALVDQTPDEDELRSRLIQLKTASAST